MPVDLSNEQAVERVVAEIQAQVGPVDVLVNNAGLSDQVLFDRAAWSRTRQVLYTNVIGLAHLTAAFVPAMVERGRGGERRRPCRAPFRRARRESGMRISRLILSGAAVGTIVGTGRADINRTHMFNPAWPAHARFHSAAGWGTIAGLQLWTLWLLWRPSQPSQIDAAVTTATVLPVAAWIPFFFALALPGTGVEDERGHLPRIAGVPLNLVPAALVPALSALGYTLHRHGR